MDDGGVIVDVPRVDLLLAERLACKKARRYEDADRIRAELKSMGIEVFDKTKQWKARGKGHMDPSTGHDYSRDPRDGGPVPQGTHALIARRLQLKMSGKYPEADATREELRALGVEVNDRAKLWRVVKDDRYYPKADEPPLKRRRA
ncbi:hypothetical protein CTAYLR_000606 [Chrysophaeum taylorii]|uniref:Cysteinyl-tRNA ligase anticodon binding domain-containing protein n=1 Tax=Chrysophaeum taylorii TaxID=2483200 RepID=A0AAD7UH78_9STRA|nr:hypothetical protein CTAYLR_000606 [Chrysophaeum taylorii]